jgi:hypothetical protein
MSDAPDDGQRKHVRFIVFAPVRKASRLPSLLLVGVLLVAVVALLIAIIF